MFVFVRVDCLVSHGGRSGERELKGQGSLEADRGAILKKFLKGRRVGARRREGNGDDSRSQTQRRQSSLVTKTLPGIAQTFCLLGGRGELGGYYAPNITASSGAGAWGLV